jgi:hypothetical protein
MEMPMYEQPICEPPPRRAYPPQYQQPPPRGILKKPFKVFDDTDKMKYAIIVSIIFLALNSKIIWNQIIKLPFMGGIEPSIIALIVNSILAGVIFYMLSNVLK